mmetsp:Transcript_14191/g.34200  ORF Transcript_14191/g.34200 Transcript_14191/m.34200 type:complete len:94 (-) Transcript_14191:971-1252(-)
MINNSFINITRLILFVICKCIVISMQDRVNNEMLPSLGLEEEKTQRNLSFTVQSASSESILSCLTFRGGIDNDDRQDESVCILFGVRPPTTYR